MNSLSMELMDVTLYPAGGSMTYNGKVTLLDADGNKIAAGYMTQIQFSVDGGFTDSSLCSADEAAWEPPEHAYDGGSGGLCIPSSDGPWGWEPPEHAYDGDSVLGLLRTLIPGIDALTARCPVDDCDSHVAMVDYSLPDVVIHLNDHHKMSRGKIAEWLDALPYDLTLGQGPKVTIESLVPKAHAPAGSATATVLASPGLVNFSGEEVCAPSYDYATILLCSCGWSTSPKTTGELARSKALNDHIKEGNQG